MQDDPPPSSCRRHHGARRLPHRATGITAYLENGGILEHAQQIAAHESPRTTKLYDRTDDQIFSGEGFSRLGLLSPRLHGPPIVEIRDLAIYDAVAAAPARGEEQP